MEKHLDICALIVSVFSRVIILFLSPKRHDLVGDWEILYPNRQKMSLHFRCDETFSLFKPASYFFISRKYLIDGNELDLSNPEAKLFIGGNIALFF